MEWRRLWQDLQQDGAATLTLNHAGVLNSGAVFASARPNQRSPSVLRPTVLRCTTTACAEFDTSQKPCSGRSLGGGPEHDLGCRLERTILRCTTTNPASPPPRSPVRTCARSLVPTSASFSLLPARKRAAQVQHRQRTCKLQDSGTNLDLQAGVIVNDTAAYLLRNNSAILRYVPRVLC